MQAVRRQHMGRNQVVQGSERHRARADLIGQRRQAESDAFARVAIALPVERLVLAVLLEQDHRQQVGTGPAPRRRMKRRRRLRDRLASPAGELLAHRLDHLPLARDRLQRLGHVLADLRQLLRAAARAGCRRRHHHPLARKMRRKRLAPGPAPREPLHLGGLLRRPLGRQFVLRRARLEIVELELKLIEKTLLALRTLAVELAPQLLDRQLEEGDLGLRVGYPGRLVRGPSLGLQGLRLGVRRSGFRRRKRLPQRVDPGPLGHARKPSTSPDSTRYPPPRVSHYVADQPARDGRQLRTGFLQSIPSSR